MRGLIIGVVAALAFASASSAGTTGNGWSQNTASANPPSAGPYKLDAKGKCRDAGGRLAKQNLCPAPAPPQLCTDPKTGHFTGCASAGSSGS